MILLALIIFIALCLTVTAVSVCGLLFLKALEWMDE